MYKRVESKEQTARNFYTFVEQIGEGAFGIVYKATKKDTGETYAIKSIDKSTLGQEELSNLHLEIDIISQVDHPNIVRAFEFYDEPKHLHVVMEVMVGGELFERIVEKDHYSEQEAALTIRPVIDAIKYCHELNIVHRDLKPENMLYSSFDLDGIVKITDFGLARFYDDDVMTTACGTPSYVAPEILEGRGYGIEVDYWSIGVILYTMLSGYLPFNEESNQELFDKIKSGDYSFPSPDWDNISDMAKDLIRRCLLVNPSERITASDMLKHPWILGENIPRNNMPDVASKIREYNARRKFRKYGNTALASNKFMSIIKSKREQGN
jgi:calcium/calmodulin-dependent protein kinase I